MRLPDYDWDERPGCGQLASMILLAVLATPVVLAWWIVG